ECFALVQVEAMMCGTPVVMTNTPGGRVPVTATGMGKLANKGDWESIGETLLEILNNREKYIKPRHEIEAIFNLERTVDLYEEAFRTAAQTV
ncbi:MAG: glycosyltransferase, partial [Anaerolineae bacterium]|nr:glycosyltransferase [Anaerolineae bacterium]